MSARREAEDTMVGNGTSGVLNRALTMTDIFLRLWTSTKLPAPVSWNTEAAIIYMIADVIAASGGDPDDNCKTALVAHFEDPSHAVNAARRLQGALLEFTASLPGQSFRLAVAVHTGSSRRSEIAQSVNSGPLLLQMAKPGQILISNDTYTLLDTTSGTQYQTITASESPLAKGARELIWTMPETYAAQQRSIEYLVEADFAGEPMSESSAIPTASLIKNTTALEPSGRFAFDDFEASNSSASQATIIYRGPIQAPPESATGPALQPHADEDRIHQELLAELQPNERSSGRAVRTAILVTVSCLVAIGLAAFFIGPKFALKHSDSVNPQTLTSKPEPQTEPPSVTTPSPVPSTPRPPAISQKQLTPSAQPPHDSVSSGNPPPTEATKPVQVRPPTAENPPETATNSGGRDSYEGFTRSQIPQLLNRADSDAGKGNYDQARYEYEIVLKLDPSNAQAKQGLRRLSLRESNSDQ
jgi:hypothetical protein